MNERGIKGISLFNTSLEIGQQLKLYYFDSIHNEEAMWSKWRKLSRQL